MRHHLIIAGTGRAGTTFLVQYLHECGFETHISHHAEPYFDKNANAGLEDLLSEDVQSPYVIKSPWIHESLEGILSRGFIKIDAVILPMRDLMEAAASRVVNELRQRYSQASIPLEMTEWRHWGGAPGGMVYSLEALDQARILAVGFHNLVYILTKYGIPIVFLDFPRFIQDGEYLWNSLRTTLGECYRYEDAMSAHVKIAKPELVRVGAIVGDQSPSGDSFTFEDLDRDALIRELRSMRETIIHNRSRIVELEKMTSDSQLSPHNE